MHWNILAARPELATTLGQQTGLRSLIVKTLIARDITTYDQIMAFIHPDIQHSWLEAGGIAGLNAVCEHLEQAIRKHKRVVVFGDYDVDGISSAALMVLALRELGTDAQVVLPMRIGEGYGLTPAALERIYQLDPEVVITVDCGISAAEEVRQLEARGIKVLITDHHEAGDNVPQGVPVADPKLESGGPSFDLAGVGVALKLIDLLGRRFDKPELWRSFTDLATLGTIADQMPLLGENRALVFDGLKLINNCQRLGVAAVMALGNKVDSQISASNLTFGLIPRLNAAGRISDPLIALELLITNDPITANQLAGDLETLNQERRTLEAQLVEQAISQAETQTSARKVTVVGGEGWHDGVKGIVASRLVRHYGVPSIVFSIEGDEAVGSGRSVGSINLYKCVSQISDMLIRFGGHGGAVGVSIKTDRLDEFRERLEAILEQEPEESFYPALKIDAAVQLAELSVEQVGELSLLEPFGNSNATPLYLLRNVFIKHARTVGTEANHLSFKATDGACELQAIWFNCPDVQTYLACNSAVDIVFNAQVETWRDKQSVKLHVVDMAIVADNIAQGLLGSQKAKLHPSQQGVLDALQDGRNTLAIMATGRGKSLIFQIHAVKLAQSQGRQSVFVYPLRALINDQEFGLSRNLAQFGLSCAALTGASSAAQRQQVFADFAAGTTSILLTTPEFLLTHKDRILTNQNIGFVVVDEAHHIATSSSGFRPLYTQMSVIGQMLPDATILALTATADQDTTQEISSQLGIAKIIIDKTQRLNLQIDDQRQLVDRQSYLANIIANSPKAIVYVNSRDLSIELTRSLRQQLPQIAQNIGFYNAGLTKEDRLKLETAFRSNDINCIVATSAFGEGINIPDIRDVVLYDLPFSLTDYNQMSGRAGRDGLPATVHLLCNSSDAEHNSKILNANLMDSEQDSQQPASEVSQTASYQECYEAIKSFDNFKDWLFTANELELSSKLQKPLLPDH